MDAPTSFQGKQSFWVLALISGFPFWILSRNFGLFSKAVRQSVKWKLWDQGSSSIYTLLIMHIYVQHKDHFPLLAEESSQTSGSEVSQNFQRFTNFYVRVHMNVLH